MLRQSFMHKVHFRKFPSVFLVVPKSKRSKVCSLSKLIKTYFASENLPCHDIEVFSIIFPSLTHSLSLSLARNSP